MSGCELCGVGPDDECADDCPSRSPSDSGWEVVIGGVVIARIVDDVETYEDEEVE